MHIITVIITGKGGSGKSTLLKHLALCWADDNDAKVQQFQFVFHISLKDVASDVKVEKLIKDQHIGLRVNNVNLDEIKAVLNSDGAGKTLLLIDGYDQYEHGSNTTIGDILEKRNLRKCLVLLSSRETQQVKVLQRYLDDEVELQGIEKEKVKKYIIGSLGDKSKAEKLSKRVKEILNLTEDEEWVVNPTPLLINMICITAMSEGRKPTSKTEAVRDLVDKYLDRESIRSTGCKFSARLKQQTVNDLAKLSWERLCGLASEDNNFSLVSRALISSTDSFESYTTPSLHQNIDLMSVAKQTVFHNSSDQVTEYCYILTH